MSTMQTHLKIQFNPRQVPRAQLTLLAPATGIPGGEAAVKAALAEQDWMILRAVSQAFQRAGLLDLALEWGKAAAEAAERSLPTQLHLGSLHLSRGDLPAARALAEQSVEALPAAGQPKRLMSQVLRQEGDLPGAIDWAKRAVQDMPYDTGLLVNLGVLQAQSGAMDEAAETARPGLEQAPANPALLRLMMRTCQASGDLDGALEWARRTVDALPGDAGALAQLGGLQLQAGAVAAAEATAREALAIAPGTVAPLRLMVQLCQQRGDLDAALDWARQAARAVPDAAAANLVVNILMQRGELEAAGTELAAALTRLPGAAPLLRTRSVLLQRQGDLDGALDYARQAAAAAPQDVGMTAHLGSLHIARGELDEARRVAEAKLDAGGAQLPLLLVLSRTALAARAVDEALDWARRAVGTAPADPRARRMLESCEAARG
jgi:tetratricopeptide (TPR) repeat protein